MKRKVCQLRLDNHRFKDSRGKWIKDFKGTGAMATERQVQRLIGLGCKREALSGLRFHVANVLIAKLLKEQRENKQAEDSAA